MIAHPQIQRAPVGMPIVKYFVTVGFVLGAVLFFGVDILYPSAAPRGNAVVASREPSKLERAIREQKAEHERDAARKAAELKIEAEREAPTPQLVVASPDAIELPAYRKPAMVERPRNHVRSPKTNKHVRSPKTKMAHSGKASQAANLALGYAAEPPGRPLTPFARSDFPF
jgi:hypothetical protein